jgi:hypothetical protein
MLRDARRSFSPLSSASICEAGRGGGIRPEVKNSSAQPRSLARDLGLRADRRAARTSSHSRTMADPRTRTVVRPCSTSSDIEPVPRVSRSHMRAPLWRFNAGARIEGFKRINTGFQTADSQAHAIYRDPDRCMRLLCAYLHTASMMLLYSEIFDGTMPTLARLASTVSGSSMSFGSHLFGPLQRPCVPYLCGVLTRS